MIETINDIFGLPPLATLPDEAQALADGNYGDIYKRNLGRDATLRIDRGFQCQPDQREALAESLP